MPASQLCGIVYLAKISFTRVRALSAAASGIIPPLADAYFQRLETGVDLKSGLFPGETVVLTHGEETEAAPAAQGGTGKTQLAVEFTHALRNARAVDVLVWVTAATRESVIAGFARSRAGLRVGTRTSTRSAGRTSRQSEAR